ncbi:PREDICTED: fibropellin-1-like isoform X2 [Acropora digitifera]|uniref:fibropellin-1-like isoform X2 n=1 Tax=Acropora digitifera TaxID=70779 RepID=UPI00077AF7AD|nr:PREDICTED: fibropellin-1-like isoform X2 [Acropora digitifera]
MEDFELTAFLKALLFMQVAVHLHAISNAQQKPCVNSEIKELDKAISRDGSNNGVSYVNLAKDNFSYLNITALIGRDFVDNIPECSLACLDTPSCFSFNVGATRDVNNRFPCELLPSDKYNNSDKFVHSRIFHHFSIATPCSSWPCKNKGKCQPLYGENNYKCLCKGFKGNNCENDIDECSSVNECHQNATCNNTKGSYNCTCKDGFEGDGKNCTDIDECSIENECHQNAICSNTKGSYNCTCKGGFKGDGRINCTEQLAKGLSNSTIIGDNQTYLVMLSRWLRPVAQSNGQWILCWRASLHGWAASTFHSLCDNKEPTVTIVKDTNNNTFGGYTSIPWRSGNRYKNDPKAFLFSLKNPTNNPRKLLQLDSSSSHSVYDGANYGPTFGHRHDLYIADSANMNSNSQEWLGDTYTVPSGVRSDPFLTGNTHFRANEIETFYETAE